MKEKQSENEEENHHEDDELSADRRAFLKRAGLIGGVAAGLGFVGGWGSRDAQGAPGAGASGTTISDEDIDAKRIAGVRIASEFITGTVPAGTDADPYPGSAIQAAIDDPGATSIFIPAGTWDISTAILPDSNQIIRGVGVATKLRVITTGVRAINIAGKSDVQVSDLQIEGNNVLDSNADGIRVTSSSTRIHLYRLKVHKCGDDGIGMSLVTDSIVAFCESHDNFDDGIQAYTTADRNYILFNSCHDNDAGATGAGDGLTIRGDHNIIHGNLSENNGNGNGILLTECSFNRVTENRCIGNGGFGIFVAGLTSGGTFNVIKGNYCSGNNDGIQFQPGFTHRGNAVLGNHCISNTNSGIRVEGTFTEGEISENACLDNSQLGINFIGDLHRDVLVKGNICAGNGSTGIFMADVAGFNITDNLCRRNDRIGIEFSGDFSSITGNTCKENSQSPTVTHSGIKLSNATNVLVSGNYCDDQQGTPTQRHGIQEIGTSDLNEIRDNFVDGNSLAQIVILGANTKLRGNRGYVTENRGTAVIANGTSSIAVAHGLAAVPTVAIATGRDLETDEIRVSARDATNVTLAVPANVTADRTVDWIAEV